MTRYWAFLTRYLRFRPLKMCWMMGRGNIVYFERVRTRRKGVEGGERAEGRRHSTRHYVSCIQIFFFPARAATSCLYYYSGATLRPPPSSPLPRPLARLVPSSSSQPPSSSRAPLSLRRAPREQAARTISYGSSREQKYECINA